MAAPPRVFALLVVALSSLLLVACDEQRPPYNPPPVSSLVVTSVDHIKAGLPLITVPSPDGKLMAGHTGEGDLCAYDSVATKHVCTKFTRAIDRYSAVWSPDSRKLTFNENYSDFHDPDIWVMDAETGKVSDLTEDNVDEMGKGTPGKEAIDVLPMWSHDGKQLSFVRYTGIGNDSIGAIYTIDASGGTATYQADLNTMPLSITAIAQSQDGKKIAYFTIRASSTAEGGGLWLLDLDSKQSKSLGDPKRALTIEFSPDGHYLMVFNDEPMQLLDWNKASSHIVAVDGSGQQEIAGGAAHYATWASTGSELAYVRAHQTNATNKSGLYIAEAPDKPGKLLYEGDFVPMSLQFPLVWASDNTFLLNDHNKRSADGNVVRLHLGTK